MDLTPRQRADIVHVVLAAAEALGLKVSAINSTWGGEHLNVHLDREYATPEQGRALLDALGLIRLLKGSNNPGDERCKPYSTVEGIASIAGVDVEVCIFTDFASPPPEPETDPEPEPAAAVTE